MITRTRSKRFLLKTTAVMSAAVIAMSAAGTVLAAGERLTASQQLQNMFTTADLMDATIADLQDALSSGRVTSAKLAEMYQNRIAAYDQSLDLHAVIAVNPEAAQTARQLDKERAEGKVRGPLHGVPIVVKDNYDSEGLPTTAGAGALSESIANDDAYVIGRLKKAGAIILAKTNLSEFAFSGSNSRSYLGGAVHNAYDTTRTAAGSSGGTAVSVTANFGAAGLGTDTGSSIRRPSSFSNLYGLRPSKGLTSIDGVVPLNADQDVTGPMCRTVEDLAVMLDTIAGTDSADRYTVDADADSLIPDEGYTAHLQADGLKGKRIGYLTNSFGIFTSTQKDETGNWATTSMEDPTELDPKIQGMVDRALGNLQAGGAELVDLSAVLPDSKIFELNGNVSAAGLTGSSDFEWDMYEYFQALGDNATMHSVADIVQDGRYVSDLSYYNTAEKDLVNPRFDETGNPTPEYAANWNARLEFRNTVSQVLQGNDIDAVVFVSQTDIPCLEEDSDGGSSVIHSNTASYLNKFGPVAGLPEMMIPMGLAEADAANGVTAQMPLGLSMFSSYGNEAEMIEIAYGYEQTAQGIRVQPPTTPALPDTGLNSYLDTLMEQLQALHSADYTSDSWAAVPLALDAAANVDKNDANAVKNAAAALAEAYDGLVKLPTSSAEPSASESSAPNSSAPSDSSPSGLSSTASPNTGEGLTAIILFTGLTAAAAAAAFVFRRKQ